MSDSDTTDQPVPEFLYDAVILAGGQGQRMGGRDKGLQVWQDKALVDHVLERLRQQTVAPQQVWISANRHLSDYAARGAVVTDEVEGFEGPLRGVQAALAATQADYLLVVPCDTPCLPLNLAQTLWTHSQGQATYACAQGQIHPLTCLLPTTHARETLEVFLANDLRRARTWMDEVLKAKQVPFEDEQAFVNLNHLHDLQ
ncbi:molybdenum cofactor guanylyltransferase MobA [Orrella sp. 11846]|uniref:molybdenum cofactor guanylyltransferase MobA n=1 Tax=Orrella sp. 11846 TaxID=3409913 RepID=UPI003B59C37A